MTQEISLWGLIKHLLRRPHQVILMHSQVGVQTSALNISAIETTSIAISSATITWQTDLPSDSQVEYGDSEKFGNVYCA